MHVLLDVHVASNEQQIVVACSIASSHGDLHEVTSISSCVDVNSQSVSPSIVAQRMDVRLGFRSTTTVRSRQSNSSNKCLLMGCELFHPPILSMSSFTIHHAVLHDFIIHHDVLVTFSLSQHFSLFPSKALRHVMVSTNSFSSLLLRSSASSSRYQSNTSKM